MSAILEYFDQAELSLAAYADLSGDLSGYKAARNNRGHGTRNTEQQGTDHGFPPTEQQGTDHGFPPVLN
jgi:hypothetical protein